MHVNNATSGVLLLRGNDEGARTGGKVVKGSSDKLRC